MVQPNLTCFCVHRMIKEMIQLPNPIVPFREETRTRMENSSIIKGTKTDRGVEIDQLWTEVDTKPISKKDLEFEYRYSTKKAVSCYKRHPISIEGSPGLDVGKSYEAEVKRYKQQRSGLRPRHSTVVKEAKSFGLSIKRVEYEDPMNSIQHQAARLRQLMLKSRPQLIPKMSYKRVKSEIHGQIVHHSTKTKPSRSSVLQLLQQRQNPNQIVQKKLNNYRDFINCIQLHYESQLIVEVKKFDKFADSRLSVFIGRGNNRNLLVTLFKKRWWWKIVDRYEQANFIWTQLKINQVFESQNIGLNVRRQPVVTSPKKKKQENEHEKKLIHRRCGQVPKEQLTLISPTVVQNHFEQNYMLGNKKALFKNLSKYCEFYKRNVFDIVPLTYHVERLNSRSFKDFCRRFKQSSSSYWIVKPGQNTNRGTGIHVTNKLHVIRRLLTEDSKHTHIIQQYLCNPMLYNRRKFDIRTYVLVNRINNVFRAYWYQEGYLRTSSQAFNLDDLEDPFIHLTNDAIQKNSEDYGKFQQGNKVSFSEFQRYLDTHFFKEKHQVQQLVYQMKSIATECIKATYFKIDPNCRQHNLEIFGLDFIVDRSFRPWLLEVNTNPCLQLSSQLLSRLIPYMVENALRIGLDPIYPPNQQCPWVSKFYLSDNFHENNRFELIFDSRFDSDPEFEHACLNEREQYEEDVEEFDNEGVELNLQV